MGLYLGHPEWLLTNSTNEQLFGMRKILGWHRQWHQEDAADKEALILRWGRQPGLFGRTGSHGADGPLLQV